MFLHVREGTMIGCHRDIVTSEATKLAELLPPADEVSLLSGSMNDCHFLIFRLMNRTARPTST